MSLYLVVEAADGYRVVFALPELDPGYTDRTILLADRRDGKPLSDREGPLQVIVPGEKKHRAGSARRSASWSAGRDEGYCAVSGRSLPVSPPSPRRHSHDGVRFKAAVRRLRHRSREILRAAAAGTLDAPTEADVDDEIRELFVR